MARQQAKDTTLIIGNASLCLDMSGFSNSLAFTEKYEEKDKTTIADTVRKRIAILGDSDFSIESQLEIAADPRTTLQGLLGDNASLFAWVESNASMAEGDDGLILQALPSNYDYALQHGEISKVDLSGNGSGFFVDAKVLQEDSSLTVTGTSTGVQVGSVAAGQTAYCDLHVLTATAGTIDVVIESDDNSGFTSATTRMTFAQVATTPSSFRQTVAGAITDDWWRVSYTIATGPYTILVMFGIK